MSNFGRMMSSLFQMQYDYYSYSIIEQLCIHVTEVLVVKTDAQLGKNNCIQHRLQDKIIIYMPIIDFFLATVCLCHFHPTFGSKRDDPPNSWIFYLIPADLF